MLVAALLFTTVIAIGLTGYISLSTTALRLSQQTYYQNSATNLAEAGLEEALYRFKIVDLGTVLATAWTDWSISGSNASRSLTDLIGDGSAIGSVKIYVTGYSGQSSTASIIAQATVTPLDGNPPARKTLKVTLHYSQPH